MFSEFFFYVSDFCVSMLHVCFFRLMFTGMIFTLWFSMQGVNQK